MLSSTRKSNDKSTDKLQEAFSLLEEAAKETKQDVRELVADRYRGIEDQISEFNDKVKQSMRQTAERIAGAAARTEKYAEEKAKEVGEKVNKDVHHRPWPYVGTAAMSGFLFGCYLMGRRKKS